MNLQKKDWNEIKSNDSWAIFKIMSEFVEGYERMSRIGPCISIFGSARTKPDNKYYQMGVEVAEKLAHKGFGIITGGGPGIMEAGNKGAKQENKILDDKSVVEFVDCGNTVKQEIKQEDECDLY